jgi:hypothetical protein
MRALAVVLLLTSACGAETPERPAAEPPPERLTGVITDVRLESDEVVSFVLRAGETSHEILIDPERDYGFDLSHLDEHWETGDPVRVELEQRGTELYAESIVDAPS